MLSSANLVSRTPAHKTFTGDVDRETETFKTSGIGNEFKEHAMFAIKTAGILNSNGIVFTFNNLVLDLSTPKENKIKQAYNDLKTTYFEKLNLTEEESGNFTISSDGLKPNDLIWHASAVAHLKGAPVKIANSDTALTVNCNPEQYLTF